MALGPKSILPSESRSTRQRLRRQERRREYNQEKNEKGGHGYSQATLKTVDSPSVRPTGSFLIGGRGGAGRVTSPSVSYCSYGRRVSGKFGVSVSFAQSRRVDSISPPPSWSRNALFDDVLMILFNAIALKRLLDCSGFMGVTAVVISKGYTLDWDMSTLKRAPEETPVDINTIVYSLDKKIQF